MKFIVTDKESGSVVYSYWNRAIIAFIRPGNMFDMMREAVVFQYPRGAVIENDNYRVEVMENGQNQSNI